MLCVELLQAVPGSTHGYDVADPTRLNPEIGDRDSYDRWVGTLRAHQHGSHHRHWCRTTWGSPSRRTRGGRTSSKTVRAREYASFFDIDWHPLKQELENKVLLPILGDSYGAVLERQEITLQYVDGAFRGVLLQHRAADRAGNVRSDPRRRFRDAALAEIGESDAGLEFLSILTAIRHLP